MISKNTDLKARRREEILNMATPIFAERGYQRTDLQVVADRLKVGKGTLYRYFPTKRALFLAAVRRGMHCLTAYVDGAVKDLSDPLEQIAGGIRAYLEFFQTNPSLVELIIQERAEFNDRSRPTYFEHRDANMGRWKDLIRRMIAAKQVRDIPVERVSEVIGNLLYGTMFTNYFLGATKSHDMQTEDILDIVLHGILNPESGGSEAVTKRKSTKRPISSGRKIKEKMRGLSLE
ncbi:MAG TPA: TetR/AcrR family transcriptional regulator [bacterium]|nr:TetR/AcrR family transcriptional regulator [bacterium]